MSAKDENKEGKYENDYDKVYKITIPTKATMTINAKKKKKISGMMTTMTNTTKNNPTSNTEKSGMRKQI